MQSSSDPKQMSITEGGVPCSPDTLEGLHVQMQISTFALDVLQKSPSQLLQWKSRSASAAMRMTACSRVSAPQPSAAGISLAFSTYLSYCAYIYPYLRYWFLHKHAHRGASSFRFAVKQNGANPSVLSSVSSVLMPLIFPAGIIYVQQRTPCCHLKVLNYRSCKCVETKLFVISFLILLQHLAEMWV